MIVIFYTLVGVLTLFAMLLLILPLQQSALTAELSLSKKPLVCACVLALPVIAIALYAVLGNGPAQQRYWTQQNEAPLVREALAQMHNPQQLIEQLKSRLAAHPDSAKGWYLLGRIYMDSLKSTQAEQALNKAHKLQPGNIEYTIALAKASFLAHHNYLNTSLLTLIQQIHAKHPKKVDVINLLALNAYSQGQYQQAINYWEKLIPLVQPGSEDSQALLQMIHQAQQKL